MGHSCIAARWFDPGQAASAILVDPLPCCDRQYLVSGQYRSWYKIVSNYCKASISVYLSIFTILYRRRQSCTRKPSILVQDIHVAQEGRCHA
jgi:hypothetical protein